MAHIAALAQLSFERNLAPGTQVVAHWTNSGRAYVMQGTVVKLNAKSIVITLAEDLVRRNGEVVYPQGRRIAVPRFADPRWSPNNRVATVALPQPQPSLSLVECLVDLCSAYADYARPLNHVSWISAYQGYFTQVSRTYHLGL